MNTSILKKHLLKLTFHAGTLISFELTLFHSVYAEENFSFIQSISQENKITTTPSILLSPNKGVINEVIDPVVKKETSNPITTNNTAIEKPKLELESPIIQATNEQNSIYQSSEKETKNHNQFNTTSKHNSEIKKYGTEPSLWQGASIVIGFISVIGILALFLTRIRKKGLFKGGKNESSMNIVSSLSISPKRQILLVQVKDKEFVITNTESGINFLTEINTDYDQNKKLTTHERKPFQIENFIKLKQNENNPTTDASIEKEKHAEQKKSEILQKAMKMMSKSNENEKSKSDDTIKNNFEDQNQKFPKYFSNAFESESKKEIKKKDETDSVENVTNLIREKLRSMKPLS